MNQALGTVLALSMLTQAGCFTRTADGCRGCTIVNTHEPTPPKVPEGQRALVVLLHGAFGFGSEWRPILAALRQRPEISFFAYDWPGPFGNKVPRRAEEFRITLQRSVDQLPSSAREVLVLAHSAGGSIAEYAARHLKVPPGVKVHIALLDAAHISVAGYTVSSEVDTPLGIALGTEQPPCPPISPGVDVGDYRAGRAPRPGTKSWRPKEIAVVPTTGEKIVYLGHVSHGGAVSLAGLPLLDQLGRGSDDSPAPTRAIRTSAPAR